MSNFGDFSRYIDLTPEDIALYLVATGWHERKVENPHVSVYAHTGTDAEVAVPMKPAFRDYELQLESCFKILEEVEDRPTARIVTDVLSTWADVVRVRINPPSLFQRNTVNFMGGVTLIDESYKMLTSAARATERPQNVYTGGLPASVAEYLRRTQLGHTEKGSFVVKIFSPTAPTPRDKQANREESFARSVTRTLHESLEGIRSAARVQPKPLAAIFEELVAKGVSANLCDALARIADVSNDRAVDVNFTWSWKNPVEQQTSATTVIPAIITPALHDMSEHLRVMQPEPNVTLIGTVAKLTNKEQAGADFNLGIEAEVDGKQRKIALELSGDARAIASQAWETGASILCVGTLDRRRFPYKLVKPTKFELLKDNPE
jgi:hypothetical protein